MEAWPSSWLESDQTFLKDQWAIIWDWKSANMRQYVQQTCQNHILLDIIFRILCHLPVMLLTWQFIMIWLLSQKKFMSRPICYQTMASKIEIPVWHIFDSIFLNWCIVDKSIVSVSLFLFFNLLFLSLLQSLFRLSQVAVFRQDKLIFWPK